MMNIYDEMVRDPHLPLIFLESFQRAKRICLPFYFSSRDLDHILRTKRSPIALEIWTGMNDSSKHMTHSLEEMWSVISKFVYQRPSETAIINFVDDSSWLYFDPEQRFVIFVCENLIVSDVFCNSVPIMRTYFVEKIDCIFLTTQEREHFFDLLTNVS